MSNQIFFHKGFSEMNGYEAAVMGLLIVFSFFALMILTLQDDLKTTSCLHEEIELEEPQSFSISLACGVPLSSLPCCFLGANREVLLGDRIYHLDELADSESEESWGLFNRTGLIPFWLGVETSVPESIPPDAPDEVFTKEIMLGMSYATLTHPHESSLMIDRELINFREEVVELVSKMIGMTRDDASSKVSFWIVCC